MWGLFGAKTAPDPDLDLSPGQRRTSGRSGDDRKASSGSAGSHKGQDAGSVVGAGVPAQAREHGPQGNLAGTRPSPPQLPAGAGGLHPGGKEEELLQGPVVRTLGLSGQYTGDRAKFQSKLPPVVGSIDGLSFDDVSSEQRSSEITAALAQSTLMSPNLSDAEVEPLSEDIGSQGGPRSSGPHGPGSAQGQHHHGSAAPDATSGRSRSYDHMRAGHAGHPSGRRRSSGRGAGGGWTLDLGTPLDDVSGGSAIVRMGPVAESRPMSREGLSLEGVEPDPSHAAAGSDGSLPGSRSSCSAGKSSSRDPVSRSDSSAGGLRGFKAIGWRALLEERVAPKASLSRRRRLASGLGVERRGGAKVKATKAKVATEETGKSDEGVNEREQLEARIRYIEDTYVKSTTLKEPGELGEQFEKACIDMGDTWKITVANPVAAALASPKYKALFAVLSVLFLAWMASSGWEVREHGRVVGREFRFVATELRGGLSGQDILDPGIADAGVLVEGCVTRLFGTSAVREGNVFRIVLPKDIEATGWWFATSLVGLPDFDPIRFTWEVKGADGWRVIGASAWRFNAVNGQYFREGTWITTTERGAVQRFDQRAPWHWAVSKVAPMFVNSAMFFVMILCGIKGFLYAGKYVLGGCLLFETLIYFTSAVADTSVQGNWFSFWWWLVIASFLSGNAVIFMRRFFVHMLVVTGLGCLTVGIVEYAWYMWDLAGFLYAVVAGVVILGIAVLLIFLRLSAVNSAYLVISDDRALYEQVWKRLCDDRSFRASLAELRRQCERALLQRSGQNLHGDKQKPNIEEMNVLQRMAIASTDVLVGAVGSFMRATPVLRIMQGRRLENLMAAKQTNVRTGKRGTLLPFSGTDTYFVKCIDQLYAQASEAEQLLRRKIRKWAFVSQGMLMMDQVELSQQAEWVLWSQAKADKVLENRIQWASIKKPERAIDKCLKRYDRKICRLVDICRESLYFQTIADMTHCLKAMSEDIDIVIDRVKNRMIPEEDASLNCGFRHVAVNLRIRSWEAEQKGVESHVCEVRLILIDFAELMTDERHKRYVEYRDKIGA